MAAPAEDLTRGAICIALFPYTLGFPLDAVRRADTDELLASLESFEDIDEIEKTLNPGDVPEAAIKLKLRRVLLLQNGLSPKRADIAVAGVTSIKETTRRKTQYYERVIEGSHPTALLLGNDPRHGTRGVEAVVNMLNVAVISKAAILRKVGYLTEDEMRLVSDRLLTAFEMDISHRLT